MASSSSSASLSSTGSPSSSAMSSTSSSSSSTRAAASSSPPPADAAPAPAPGRVDDDAFPPLETAPPPPPRSGRAAPPPPPLRRSRDRRSGGKTPSYTFDRDTVKLSLASLYGSADDTLPGTAATAEAVDAAPAKTSATAEAGDAAEETSAKAEALDAALGKTSATAEAGDAAEETAAKAEALDAALGKTSATAEAGDAAEETAAKAEALDAALGKTTATAEAGDAEPATTCTAAATISTRPPIGAAPGRFAAASAVLSGAPTLLPAVQAFGGYAFGSTFGDFFEDLRRAPAAAAAPGPPPPPPPLQAPHFLNLVPLQFQIQWLQAPGHLNAPTALVPFQGPPPQFTLPSHLGLAAPHHHHHHHPTPPFQLHGYPFASPVLIQFQFEHHHGSLTGFAYAPWRPSLPVQPQLGPAVPVATQRCQDCWIRPPDVQLSPCGHVSLCYLCYLRRQRCPCCDDWIEWPPIQYLF